MSALEALVLAGKGLNAFSHIFKFYFFVHSQLSEGSLEENFVVDGSRITLLPKAETGLLVSPFSLIRAQREEIAKQFPRAVASSKVFDYHL
jgi:hypothetical protein